MPQELTAFVSCSFDEDDRKQVVEPLVDLIRNCGVDPRPLNQMPEQGHLTDVIVESIKRHRLFVAIVTKRDMTSNSTMSSPLRKRKSPGSSGAKGALRTSPLIIQEIGIACAFEKPMVVFRERGIDHEELGLARGVSEVEFDRDTLCEQLKKPTELRERMERLVGSARRHCLDTSHIIDTLDVIVGGNVVAGRSRGERTMKVRQLTDAERWMNEATFLQGLQFLHEQILEEVNEFRPDVFVGINATGVMIAAYLNARLFGKAARPVGMVTTGTYKGKLKRSTDHTVPYDRIDEHHDVLVVDSQFKSGRNSCDVIGEIKEKLKRDFARRDREERRSRRSKRENRGRRNIENVRFSFAALIACYIDVGRAFGDNSCSRRSDSGVEPIKFESLFDSKVNKAYDSKHCGGCVPDFLAFVTKGPVKAPKGMT